MSSVYYNDELLKKEIDFKVLRKAVYRHRLKMTSWESGEEVKIFGHVSMVEFENLL
ncbi:U exon, partial [Tree shrew adenovirus 1]|uniref:U exon n=1 Tax=Tree shrew adenovirus serotype 1 TaxID=47680 RepID=UPI00001D97AF